MNLDEETGSINVKMSGSPLQQQHSTKNILLSEELSFRACRGKEDHIFQDFQFFFKVFLKNRQTLAVE